MARLSSGKMPNEKILEWIQIAVNQGKIRFSDHALKRMTERNITFFDVKEVLKRGYREPSKDAVKNGSWRYAIRHDMKISSAQKRRLRVPVAFDKDDDTVIVTAIDIDQNEAW